MVMRSKYTFRHLFSFLLVVTFCLMGMSNKAGAQTINVALPDTFVTETQSLLIPVNVSDVSNLGILSFSFTIAFDPTIINIQDVVDENSISAGYLFLNNFSVSGKVIIAAAGVETLSGDGPLFYLQASFLQDGSSEMNFDKASFAEDAFDVETQNGRLRNISLASVDGSAELPDKLLLSTNYPNPFNSSSTITVDLPEAAQVLVEIYNLNGQLQGSYPPRFYSAGTNQLITVEASSLPTGSYVYRIVANSTGTIRFGTGALTVIH